MKGWSFFVARKALALVACVAIACSLASMAPASYAMGDAGEGLSLQAGGAASGETADSALLTTTLETQVSKSDYTLYSNGTLVIHDNLRGLLESTQLFNESDPEWDIDLFSKDEDIYHKEYPDKTVYAYINPNVKQIVIECDPEEMCVGSLICRFPNVKRVEIRQPYLLAYGASLGGVSSYAFDDDGYSHLMEAWNAKFDSKLYAEDMIISPDEEVRVCYTEITEDLTIAALDYCVPMYNRNGGFTVLYSDHVRGCGATFELISCDIDPSSSVVGGGSAVYNGSSYEDVIRQSIRVKCKQGHGKDSGAQGKLLEEDWDISSFYYNTRTKQYWDTTSAGTIRISVTGIYGHEGKLTGYFTIKPFELTSKNIKLANTAYTYTGSPLKPSVTFSNVPGLKADGSRVEPEEPYYDEPWEVDEGDYDIEYKNNTDATDGGAMVVITGKGNYAGKVTLKFSIAKAANPIAASAKSATVSAVYNDSKAVATPANVKVSKAQGAVTYANASKNATAKKFTVDKKTGAVTVPKGTKVGTYPVVVKASAAGNDKYKAGSKTVSFKVEVAKAANPVTVKAATSKVPSYMLRVRAVTVAPLSVSKAQGKVTYSRVSGSSALFVNKTSGKVTVKTRTKVGTYTMKVRVNAAGNANYAAANKDVTVRVSVAVK